MTRANMASKPAPEGTRASGKARSFRPEIQALRALAMGGVVLFHLWPQRITGGYIGVDVFFVISGFLITSHLLREVETSGTLSLSSFYARRIRRLLPAAMLVLACTAIATAVLVPSQYLPGFLFEVIASALYFVNWVLAANSVDYFASEGPESPVQHYWSLSVEEQFYLVLPLIVLIVAKLASSPAVRRRALHVVLWVIFVGCLIFSIIVTAKSPQAAYFMSPAHAWEFVAGGLLAIAQPRIDASSWAERLHLRTAMLWAGMLGIVATMLIFDALTPIPGWIAIFPTAATLAVILAGDARASWSPSRLLSWRPIQFGGDISYSAYLWHWPLIVLLPFALGRVLDWRDKLVILMVTILLSWLTRRFIETPVIAGKRWKPKWVSYAFALASSCAVIAMCLVPMISAQKATANTEQSVIAGVGGNDDCLGAAAMADPASCTFAHSVNPDLEVGELTYEKLAQSVATKLEVPASCTDEMHGSEVCTYGDQKDASATIALVGDSHVEHFLPAMAQQAAQPGWAIRVYNKRSCPLIIPEWEATGKASYKQNDADCVAWRGAMMKQLVDDPDIDVVLVATYSHRISEDGTAEVKESMRTDLGKTWDQLTAAGKKVVVVGDTPLASSGNVASCLESEPAGGCANPREAALPKDPMVGSIEAAKQPPALLSLTDAFCDEKLCYAAIGGLAVYADVHHLNPAFSLTLAPRFTDGIRAALGQ